MMAWRAAVAAAVVITRVFLVACCCVLLVVVQLPAVAPLGGGGGNNNISNRRYNAMFSFGDSTVDTGNICANKSAADPLVLTMAQPPYGISYFGGHPTCRCSDGRLVVNFLAQALGLPLLPPSKVSGGDFRRGANMAIAGATALDFDFLESIGLGFSFWNNGAMNLQLQWFRQLLPSICATAPQEADSNGRSGHRRPGTHALRVLPALPVRAPEQQQVRLRRVRLPQAVQRAGHPPQLVAADQPRRRPGQALQVVVVVVAAAGGSEDHVRRLLHRRRPDDAEPGELGIQERHRGVLRLRRRRVQLGARRPVRHEGRHRVRRPVQRRVLGRRPHDGGGQPDHRRRLAQGTLLPPAHSAVI